MSAPAATSPAAVPTAIPRRGFGPGTNHDFWTVPTTAVAGALTGLVLRGWLSPEARFALVVLILGGILAVTAITFAIKAAVR